MAVTSNPHQLQRTARHYHKGATLTRPKSSSCMAASTTTQVWDLPAYSLHSPIGLHHTQRLVRIQPVPSLKHCITTRTLWHAACARPQGTTTPRHPWGRSLHTPAGPTATRQTPVAAQPVQPPCEQRQTLRPMVICACPAPNTCIILSTPEIRHHCTVASDANTYGHTACAFLGLQVTRGMWACSLHAPPQGKIQTHRHVRTWSVTAHELHQTQILRLGNHFSATHRCSMTVRSSHSLM